MPAPVVGVVGMRALRRDVKALTDNEQSKLYAAIKAAGVQAVEPIVSTVRSTLPHVSGTLAGDVRSSGTKTGAAVRMGRKTVNYAGWVEFGGIREWDDSSREYIPAGRYLFPAAKNLAPRAADLYARALDRVVNDPAVWTNTTNDGGQVRD